MKITTYSKLRETVYNGITDYGVKVTVIKRKELSALYYAVSYRGETGIETVKGYDFEKRTNGLIDLMRNAAKRGLFTVCLLTDSDPETLFDEINTAPIAVNDNLSQNKLSNEDTLSLKPLSVIEVFLLLDNPLEICGFVSSNKLLGIDAIDHLKNQL